MRKRTGKSLTMPLSRSEMRTNLTLVAFVCNDAVVQSALPQILIIPSRCISEDDCRELQDQMPKQLLILRRAKAWMNEELMLEVIELLAHRIAHLHMGREWILYADAFQAHLTSKVLRSIGRRGFRYCSIPTGLTWALQPCDTHLFGSFKHWLRCEMQVQELRVPPHPSRLICAVTAVGLVVERRLQGRSWANAFLDVGLTGSQASVSSRVLNKLGFGCTVPHVSTSLPSLQQLECVLPRSRFVAINDLFAFFLLWKPPLPEKPAHIVFRLPGEEQVRESMRAQTCSHSQSSQSAATASPAHAQPPWEKNRPVEIMGRRPATPPFLPNAKKMKPLRGASWREPSPPLPPPQSPPLKSHQM